MRALAVPFRVLSLKNMTGGNVLFLNLVPLRSKNVNPYPQYRILIGVLFKISNKHSRLFHMGVRAGCIMKDFLLALIQAVTNILHCSPI